MPSRERGHFFMAYIRGEAREQTTMFPATLDELIPVDHICRVMEAFVGRVNMAKLGFVRAEPAETGRPGYDPRDLLKLYLYGDHRSTPYSSSDREILEKRFPQQLSYAVVVEIAGNEVCCWLGRIAASRHPAATVSAPNTRCLEKECRVAGCALFPQRTLRC